MDIYDLFDLIAVALAAVVSFKVRNKESVLLLIFFVLSSLLSFALFRTELYIYWPATFTTLCVVFGLSSNRHPVTLGYAAYLIFIGCNEATDFYLYSECIYLTFAFQLWVIRYGSDHGRYIGYSGTGRVDSSRDKDMAKRQSQ